MANYSVRTIKLKHMKVYSSTTSARFLNFLTYYLQICTILKANITIHNLCYL